MPIFLHKQYNNGVNLLVWEITESETELLTELPSVILTDLELSDTYHPQKRLELLASRLAIYHLANLLNVNIKGIKKDEHGKPFIVDSEWNLSLTHSKSFIGVVFHKSLPIGIDIEIPNHKLWKIANRLFVKEEIELVAENLNIMSIFWSAKESLYKLYGKRKVDFRENLKISLQNNMYRGHINMPNHISNHEIIIEHIRDYILVIAI
jgi:4'-phosphopantetheinyl transferase